MKKSLYLILFLPTLLLSQIEIDNQWKNSIGPIFQNLDKSRISSGILLDYAMEFTDVTAYNGVITDTTYIDANVMGDIYKTLFMGKVVADTVNTPLFERYAYNWARERYTASLDLNAFSTKEGYGINNTKTYILSGLFYEYQKFDPAALS